MPENDYVETFADGVRDHELGQVAARRKLVHGVESHNPTTSPLERDLVGLAFSGGGIRSATFNLGILQALASLGLLTRIDYLSTVSGGGYIAGWLAGWVRRETSEAGPPGIVNVQRQLNPSRFAQQTAVRLSGETGQGAAAREQEPEPIRHLRAYSRYISPRFGMLSLDTWAVVGIYLRNLLANILLFFFVAITLALVCRAAVQIVRQPSPCDGASWAVFVIFVVLMCAAQLCYRWFLANVRNASRIGPPSSGRTSSSTENARSVFLGVVLPCTAAAFCAIWLFSSPPSLGSSRLPEDLRVSRTAGDPLDPVWRIFNTVGVERNQFNAGLYWLKLSDDGKRLNSLGEYVAYGTFFGVFGAVMFFVGGLMRSGEWAINPCRNLILYYDKLTKRSYLRRIRTFVLLPVGAVFLAVVVTLLSPFLLSLVCSALLVLAGGLVVGLGVSSPRGRRRWQRGWHRPRAWGKRAKRCWWRARTHAVSSWTRRFGAGAPVRPTGGGRGAWQWVKDSARAMTGSVAFGFSFGLLLCSIINNLLWSSSSGHTALGALGASFGVPLFLASLVLGGYIDAIISGISLSEYEREWRARVGAMMLRLAAVWAALFAVVFYLPWLVLDHNREVVAAVVWASGGAGTYLFRKSPSGAAEHTRATLWDRLGSWVLLIAPPLILAGMVGSVSALTQHLPGVWNAAPGFLGRVEDAVLGSILWWLVVAVVAGVAYAFFVRPNLFSLHLVYGNRLVRCYLGASRRKREWERRPARALPGSGGAGAVTNVNDSTRLGNPFTGFGPRDDFSLLWLGSDKNQYPKADPSTQEPWKEAREPYSGPYPLFNTTLNLVGGEELAVQDRKGESFVLTPDYCGSTSTGYARLAAQSSVKKLPEYRNLTVGRAVTISGAAVDPNMRNYQTAAFTLLLTVLNLRTGWWLQNPWPGAEGEPTPGKPAWTGEGPWSAQFLINEAFGATRADSRYVHLSDGGHFENTGAYELIRRRCRYVVIVDAAEDPADASENLANLIRLVRIDFGIEIEIDTGPLRKGDGGLSRWHCAVGAIRYDEVDPDGVTGTLVFIRSSLTGDEPADIRNYAATHSSFPHDSTANQFFDEDQFESYRALGHHIGMAVFACPRAAVGNAATPNDEQYRRFNRDFFAAVRREWSPLPAGQSEKYAQSCEDYLQVVADLRDKPRLRCVSRALFAEARNLPAPYRKTPDASRKPAGVDTDQYYTDLHEVDYLLQVMELAWLANELDKFAAHPLSRGWMNVFRRWTASGVFQRFWPVLRGNFSREFVRFCSVALNLDELPVKWCRIPDPAVEPWKTILYNLGVQFQREWAESLRAIERLNPPQQRDYLRTAVSHSKGAKGQFLAWVITNGRGGEESGVLTPGQWEETPDKEEGVQDYSPEHTAGQGPVKYLPLGLVVAFNVEAARREWQGQLVPTSEGAGAGGATLDEDWELLVWIRGPYRTLGLGRGCLPSLLEDELRGGNIPGPEKRGILRELPVKKLFVRYPQLTSTISDRLQRTIWRWFFNDNDFVRERVSEKADSPPVIRLFRTSVTPITPSGGNDPGDKSADQGHASVRPAGQLDSGGLPDKGPPGDT